MGSAMTSRETEEWFVPAELAGSTLTAALRQFCDGYSWSKVRRLVETRRVAVNRVLSLDESRRLAAGERVSLSPNPLPAPPDDRDVSVRHFDESLIVAEKPAGMVALRHGEEIHWPPARRRRQTSLDEVLLRLISQKEWHERDLSTLPPKLRRQHLRSVHRIDRDTSGLLVFARTLDSEQKLVEQFATHTIQRTYLALVTGQPTIGELRSRLVRDRGDGRRGSTNSETDGKLAVTHIREVEPLGEFSIVRCQLETGRTHQIRIQLSEAGFPVCGDWTYRAPMGSPEIVDSSDSPRLALHACELAFEHPSTGEPLCFEMPLPKDLTSLVGWLRPPQPS
jgi:23S rRNA pseudouridine1911/1915/1917 synthase